MNMWQRGEGLGTSADTSGTSSGTGALGARPNYSKITEISANEVMQYGIGKRKRIFDDDDSLEEDDPDEGPAYQPAPGSPGPEDGEEEEEEEDPLDSFMAGIEVQAKKDKDAAGKKKKEVEEGKPETTKGTKKDKLGRTDIEEEDMQESYFTWMEEHKLEPGNDEEDDIEYDEEGNAFKRKKIIDPLPSVDHSTIEYEDFVKNFYEEHKDIQQLNVKQTEDLRRKLGIKVMGPAPCKPVCSFAHFGFDESLMNTIRKSEYSQPTPIQAQGIPMALSGRDVIGIAKTGSGKTAAYLWPALVHIMDQKELESGDGPIALICVPTRELALQVYSEAKRFGKVYNINVVCAYGGGSKWEQSKALQEGAEIVVATPGRMIDLVKIEATNLRRVTFLVFDEADRMFDLGFEAQVKSLSSHVRPDRQCLMFSATFKKKVERLAREALTDPIRIIQGELGEANQDVEQIVQVLPTPQSKWQWLLQRLVNLCSIGKVLIFVTRKQNCQELATNLKAKDFEVGLLHGDMLQQERNEIIQKFRKESLPVLVATDVAARGLDIPAIKTVVNYDVARDLDTHVHRVGRTGRAGEKGTAFTLTTAQDKEFAGHLVRSLESVNQPVPKNLMDLALQVYTAGAGKASISAPAAGKSSFQMAIKAPSIPPSSSARGESRLSTLKAAFSSSYKSNFHGASDDTAWKSSKPPEDKKKKSRWD